MFVLRYIYLLTLSLWVGGMVVLGALAAPVTFEILEARVPAEGRVLAGAVFGEILRRFHVASYAAAVILIAALVAMALLGPRPAGFAARIGIVAVMLATSLYSGIPLTAQITQLQDEIRGPVQSLPASDPRRARFGRLHGLSTTLMMVNVLGAVTLLYWEAKE